MLCHGARMTRQRAIVDEASHHHPSSTQRTMRLPPDPHRIACAPPLRRSDDDNTTIYFPLQKMRKTRVSFSLVGSCAPASVQCGLVCSFHTRSHAAHSHAARVCARAQCIRDTSSRCHRYRRADRCFMPCKSMRTYPRLPTEREASLVR